MASFLGYPTNGEDGGRPALRLHSKPGINGGTLSPIRLRYFDDEEESDEANDDKYDALNDETFGAADKSDWECFHEQLVRLELDGQKRKGPAPAINVDGESQSSDTDTMFDDYDLDLELRSFDCCETNDEASSRSSPVVLSSGDGLASKLQLDPKIWDSTIIKQSDPTSSSELSSYQPSATTASLNFSPAHPSHGIPSPPVTMLSVQDIERNVIQQQQQQKQLVQQQQHLLLQQQKLIAQQQQQLLHQSHLQTSSFFSKPNAFPTAMTMPNQEYRSYSPQSGIPTMLPSMSPHRVRTPIASVQLQATNPHPFYRGCAPGPSFLPTHGPQMPYNIRATSFSTPMNNLTMHPAFGHPFAYPSVGGPYRSQFPVVPLQHPASAFLWSPNTYNAGVQTLAAGSALRNSQYNQHLMQGIQQNHPLLAYNRQVPAAGQNQALQHIPFFHAYRSKQQAALLQQQEVLQQQQRQKGLQVVDHDEYANMMSNREKLWLIGLQWAQLNIEIPYYSDYYFTMHRQRLAALKNNSIAQCNTGMLSKLAKSLGPIDIVLNPSSAIDPNYSRNDLEGREVAPETGHTGTPLWFENSLGKVHAGSFTTPRKLMEMSSVGENDQSPRTNTAAVTHSLIQRKVRNVLLLIEHLYTLVLKMEDLGNPLAIEAARLLREKKIREGELAAAISANVNEHAFSGLATAVVSSVSQDAITAMLGVRKGKILLRRVLTLLRNHSFRWILWTMIFKAVPFIRRSDRVDAGGFLIGLFDEFECQLQDSKMYNLLRISETIDNDHVLRSIRDCNFVMSSIVCIIFQVELIYGRNPHNIQFSDQEQWVVFLEHVLKAITDAAPLECSVRMRPDSDIVHTLRVHFERFGSRIDGSDLLAFISANAVAEISSCYERTEN